MQSSVKLFLLILLSSGFLSQASPLTKEEVKALDSAGWKLPLQLPPERIQRLLSVFIEKTYEKAFRYLGVEEDFFHGHLLFESEGTGNARILYPRAILYHTQEEAHAAHWGLRKAADLFLFTPGEIVSKQYDYVNVTTRNWIQWLSDDPNLDGTQIENARAFLDTAKKDPAEFFDEKAAPKKELHYTVQPDELDAAKMGFPLYGNLQFNFYQTACQNGDEKIIEIAVPNIPSSCVKISTPISISKN